jgi:hypothetical protein
MKRTGREELIGVVIHICMGAAQGISLCSYLHLELGKCHVSLFIFYVFSPTKSENRRTGSASGWVGGGELASLGVVGGAMWWAKEVGG